MKNIASLFSATVVLSFLSGEPAQAQSRDEMICFANFANVVTNVFVGDRKDYAEYDRQFEDYMKSAGITGGEGSNSGCIPNDAPPSSGTENIRQYREQLISIARYRPIPWVPTMRMTQAPPVERRNATADQKGSTVKYGFCFINILMQTRPGTYHIPNHAYFSNVFQVPAARANSGAITGDTNRLLNRMLKLIQDQYGEGGPDQSGKIWSCRYEKTAEAAESARIGEQGTQKRSQGGARIIETLSTLGMPPA